MERLPAARALTKREAEEGNILHRALISCGAVTAIINSVTTELRSTPELIPILGVSSGATWVIATAGQ
jgi:hypothetical protein